MAAERLGSSGRPEAIERLTNYLAAESRSLALAAARGLGASGSPDARGPLEALLNEDDPALRLAGAEALGELGDPDSAEALLRALPAGDLVAQAAMRSLIRLARLEGERRPKSTEHVRPLLCDAAFATNPALAVQAANAILVLGIACNPDKLRSRLAHGGDVAGALAAAAVVWAVNGQTKTSAVLDEATSLRLGPLIGSLMRNGSAQVRPLAARAAGTLGLSALAPELERARKEAGAEVERARERWMKPRADGGATPAGEARSTPSLFDAEPQNALELWGEASAAELRLSLPGTAGSAPTLAGDPAPAVRIAAARAVPALPAAEQWPVLHPLLEDSEPDVRAAARAQLAKLDSSVGREAGAWMLAELAQATSESSVSPLIDALSRLSDVPGLDPGLIAALGRPETAPAAATALARIGDPTAVAAILDRLRQPYALALPELLAAAASRAASLAPAQASAAAEAARALLFHPRPEVRAAAVHALFALASPAAASEVFSDIQPLAGDYDLRVRRAVAER
jgi:HEAT repeat protein